MRTIDTSIVVIMDQAIFSLSGKSHFCKRSCAPAEVKPIWIYMIWPEVKSCHHTCSLWLIFNFWEWVSHFAKISTWNVWCQDVWASWHFRWSCQKIWHELNQLVDTCNKWRRQTLTSGKIHFCISIFISVCEGPPEVNFSKPFPTHVTDEDGEPLKSVEEDMVFPFGTIITYTCDPGYIIEGTLQNFTQCINDGGKSNWSQPLPRCIRKYVGNMVCTIQYSFLWYAGDAAGGNCYLCQAMGTFDGGWGGFPTFLSPWDKYCFVLLPTFWSWFIIFLTGQFRCCTIWEDSGQKTLGYNNFCAAHLKICESPPHFLWQNCAHGYKAKNE